MVSSSRGTEAPMDFQWTNRLEVKPSWAADNSSTRKSWCRSCMTDRGLIRFAGTHDDMKPAMPSVFTAPQTPIFGSNKNVPFMFSTAPSPPHPPPWAPPPFFSPEKAFPNTPIKDEPKDVDMAEISPQRFEERKVNHGRAVAPGAMRRVYNSRYKPRDTRMVRRQGEEGENGDADRSDSDDDVAGSPRPATQNTSNHYTLNLPAISPPQSDLPYILLGCVSHYLPLYGNN